MNFERQSFSFEFRAVLTRNDVFIILDQLNQACFLFNGTPTYTQTMSGFI